MSKKTLRELEDRFDIVKEELRLMFGADADPIIVSIRKEIARRTKVHKWGRMTLDGELEEELELLELEDEFA